MSRCYPFPPPGYLRNGARRDAFMESIKLRKEMEENSQKERKERKEKKREKKEKRKEKKEKKEKKERKHKEGTSSHAVGDDGKNFKLRDKVKDIKADGKLEKGEDNENEQLERSGITEELDQPVSTRESCLSDSTQSSKRKRSTSDSSHDDDHGSAIRIRLPLRKHREPENSKLECKPGSSSGSMGIFTQDTGVGDLKCLVKTETKQILGNCDSKHRKAVRNVDHGDAVVTNYKLDDESQRMASLYKSLLQIPLLTSDGFDSVDQDWLFRSETAEARPVSKKPKFDSDIFPCSQSVWPRAQYLPEVEVYALPYAVPF